MFLTKTESARDYGPSLFAAGFISIGQLNSGFKPGDWPSLHLSLMPRTDTWQCSRGGSGCLTLPK